MTSNCIIIPWALITMKKSWVFSPVMSFIAIHECPFITLCCYWQLDVMKSPINCGRGQLGCSGFGWKSLRNSRRHRSPSRRGRKNVGSGGCGASNNDSPLRLLRIPSQGNIAFCWPSFLHSFGIFLPIHCINRRIDGINQLMASIGYCTFCR